MEKVNLAGIQRGMLEVTGRAVIIAFNSFFSVKKVDGQGDEQENEKKSQVEKLNPLYAHVILYVVGLNINRKD